MNNKHSDRIAGDKTSPLETARAEKDLLPKFSANLISLELLLNKMLCSLKKVHSDQKHYLTSEGNLDCLIDEIQFFYEKIANLQNDVYVRFVDLSDLEYAIEGPSIDIFDVTAAVEKVFSRLKNCDLPEDLHEIVEANWSYINSSNRRTSFAKLRDLSE